MLFRSAFNRHLRALLDRIGRPPIAFTTEPAHVSLFTRSTREPPVRTFRGFAASTSDLERFRLTQQVHRGGCLPGNGPINISARQTSVEIAGMHSSHSWLEAQITAYGANEKRAARLLHAVQIEHRACRLRLASPGRRGAGHCQSEFLIACAPGRAIRFRGFRSAVRLADFTGGVDIRTNHARVTLLNVSSIVTARVPQGIIDYSGVAGAVSLFAGWEINLNLPAPRFDGPLEATADGPVRVLLNPNFATSFQANVAAGADFVCRASIAPHLVRIQHDGRVIYSYGKGEPAIRLVSRKGPVVIDDANALEEETVQPAILRPTRPSLLAYASANPLFEA